MGGSSISAIGERLRRERLQKGLDLARIAQQTRISEKFLEAIEAGDRSELPGGFFYRSFVRQYAAALGMDAPELDRELERLAAEETPAIPGQEPGRETIDVPRLPPPHSARTKARRQLISAGLLLIAVMLGCSGLYVLWQRSRRAEPSPEKPAPAAVSPESRAGSATGTPAAPPPPVTPAPSQAAAEPQAAAAVESPQAAAPEPAAGAYLLELTATAPVWVSVTGDGRLRYSGTLAAGQARSLRVMERARVLTGNAGGLEVRWNGKSIGPVGPVGQVRAVEFAGETFQVVVPRKPAPEESPQEP